MYSDHILNLLEEIRGQLPEDRERIRKILETYLNFSEKEKELFRMGRRMGYFRKLGDMDNPSLKSAVEDICRQVKDSGYSVDEYITQLMSRFL